MGTTQAMGYAEAVADGTCSLGMALAAHLQGNHFPPVSTVFVPTCRQAIEAYNAENFDLKIEMPNGIEKTASEIVDGLHLYAFCDQIDYGYEDDETYDLYNEEEVVEFEETNGL